MRRFVDQDSLNLDPVILDRYEVEGSKAANVWESHQTEEAAHA
jgi:hypothetical protein